MKAYFAWKQLKAAHSRNFWKKKKKIAGMVLFAPWLATDQWKWIVENCNSVGAGAHKVQQIVKLWPNFDPCFPDIWHTWKREILYIEKGWS